MNTFNIITHASPYWPESKVYIEGYKNKADREQAIEALCFKYSTWFFENLTEFEGKPTRLEKFQIEYLLDDNPLKVTNKSRQMGGSMQISLAKFFNAYRRPNYRCDIVSINLKEATDKIRYIRNFWETLPGKWKIPLATDNALSIGFHDGARKSYVNSLAASAGVRGGKKDMVFDEFAHIEGAEQLFIAAAPAALNGDLGIELVSTPLGKNNMFGQIFLNLPNEFGKKPYRNFSRHQFIWIDSKRFSKDFELGRYRWYTEYEENLNRMDDLVEEFATDKLLMFYEMYPSDYFLQEFGGAFIDDSKSFFPQALLAKVFKGSVGRVETDSEIFEEPFLPIIDNRPEGNDNKFIMGVDFGESGEKTDKTSIQIFEKDTDGILKHRYSRILSKKDFHDFPAQAAEIAKVARHWGVVKIAADATGLGRGVVPVLKRLVPDIPLDEVNFNIKTKEEMAMNLKLLMEQNKIWLMDDHPDSKLIKAELMSIVRVVSEANHAKFYAEKSNASGNKGHDDTFWAIALAAKDGVFKHFDMYTIDSLVARLASA
jgi:phage FluMu gp28-like protein